MASNSSADQDAWVALAEAIRSNLAKVVPLIPAMKPDEIDTIIRATDSAMRLHLRASTFDAAHAREEQRPVAPEHGI